jgi:hypothetical protein
MMSVIIHELIAKGLKPQWAAAVKKTGKNHNREERKWQGGRIGFLEAAIRAETF